MISWTIDRRFVTPANADVLRFLRQGNPSAHSEVAEELIRSGASLPGVHHYCPDPARDAFVVLHLEDPTIVGWRSAIPLSPSIVPSFGLRRQSGTEAR